MRELRVHVRSRPGWGTRACLKTLAVLLLVVALQAVFQPGPAWAAPESLETLARTLASRVEGPEARVLLLGITDRDGAVTGLERYLSDRLAAALTATGRVSLTDEKARQAALAEIRGNLADVIDPATAQAAGRLAGAAWLVGGTAYLAGPPRVELFLQLMRTQTGEYWQVGGVVPLEPAQLALRQQPVLRPAAPPARPPLRLEMAVLASRPDGRGGAVDLGVVLDGHTRLRSNDNLKVYFRTNADAYVYLVWVESQGRTSLQFPSGAAGLRNRVRGGEVHTAPEASKWYYLDRHPGVETLYLFASYEPLADLGPLLRQAEAGVLPADPAARQGVERLFDDFQAKGSGGVRDGPTHPVAGKGSATVPVEFSVVPGYAHAVRRLRFSHDP